MARKEKRGSKVLNVQNKPLLGLKVISLILYVSSALLILSALLSFLSLPAFGILLQIVPLFVYILYPLGLIIPYGGEILFIGFSVLLFFQGKWMWKGERRARNLVLLLCIIDGYLALATMTTLDLSLTKVIVELIICLFIALYLIWLFYSERKKEL